MDTIFLLLARYYGIPITPIHKNPEGLFFAPVSSESFTKYKR